MSQTSNFWSKFKKKGLKRIITHTIPARANKYSTEFVDWLGYKIYKNKPLQDIIIIESHNDFDSHGGAFYDYLIENRYNRKYKIVWFLRNECPKNLPANVEGYRYNKPSLKRTYYHCVARYIVCGHYMIPSVREGQKSIYTTHGAFALKDCNGKIILLDDVNFALIPSEEVEKLQAYQYTMKSANGKLVVLGYPCHDVFYDDSPGDLQKITNKSYCKTILWMPTFRQAGDRHDSKSELPIGIPIFKSIDEYQELNAWLNMRNILLIIKIHPMQNLSKVKVKTESNIIVLNGDAVKKLNVDNYKLMKDVDALISDYSSSSYDFLHLDKPIAYTLDDLQDYELKLPIKNTDDYIGGQKIYSKDEFYLFLQDVADGNDKYAETRKKCFDLIFKYHDGNSCKRLCDFLGL